MVAIKLELLLFLNILYVTNGSRRITNGREVDVDKGYVVYLVKAPESNKMYDEWLCGGALVSTWFILTSAACVSDVEHMYAIAGYNKYVPDAEIETDKCTKEKKKKVVYTCVPMDYRLLHFHTKSWAFVDLAFAKVESAYDLEDSTFKTLCSYIPTVIDINYEKKFTIPGINTLVYGWGHTKLWRQMEDNTNYNNPTLLYTASKIYNKPQCVKDYDLDYNFELEIQRYMICTYKEGEFNDKGEFLTIESPNLMGCNNKQLLNHHVNLNGEIVPSSNTSKSNDSLACEDDDTTYQDVLIDATRRGDGNTNQTSSDSLQNKNRTVFNRTTTRKNGICQNDHGGPLVTWVGGNEILIGIATLFQVSDDFKCMGPYLYTSTYCNGAFIHCTLAIHSDLPDIKSRRAICDSPPTQRGYDTVERYISWEHHPSGTADNERNANGKIIHDEQKRRYLQSPEVLQKLMRFDMLLKMAKDRSKAILRQQRQRV